MDLKKDYRYYVVHFSHLPYSDIDQYVCIPDSWILLREIEDQVVVAKFPVENLSITKKRVKDGEVFSDDWSIYVADVKHGTDSYEDAEKYIKTLKEKLTNRQSCSEPVNNGDTLSKLSKTKVLRRSKRNQSNRSVNKPQISEAPSNYSIEPVSEPLAVISTEIETLKIQTNRVETINTANEVIKQTDASSESLHDEQLLSNTKHYLHEITIRQENNDEKLNNVDSIENDNGPQDIARNKSPANHDGPQLTNESLDATIVSEPISDTGNLGQVKNASECTSEESFLKLIDQTCDGLFQYCKSLEKLMDKINNQYYCGSYTPFNPTIKDAVAPVVEEKEREEKEIEKKRQVLKRTQAETGIIKRREAERNKQEIDDSADIEDAIKDAVAPVVEEEERKEKEIEKKRHVPKRTQAEIGIIKRREAERKEQEIDDSADIEDAIKDAVAPVVEEKEREEKEIEKKKQVLKRTQAEIGIIKRRKTERNKQEIDDSAYIDNGDDDDKNDDDDDYVKRKRFQSRTLTLPPEYDKNDSKWTLRYREYAPGLVELIEHTGVYINAVKLINCKRLAKNSKTLARLLLVEIFTESALCTCSLTGVRAKAFDIDGTHIRPGLDENARTVLLTYVEQYAQASKWPKTDNQSILNSIRNKMQEIRFKCNK